MPVKTFRPALVGAIIGFAVASQAAEASFVSMFNGRDLTGWVNANCAPETWSVREGVIHCTGRPTGAMRTTRQYENFILELEWRHLSSGGNSGVFLWGTPIAAPGVPYLRGIEVQVLDNGFNIPGKNEWYTTHGDVFPIHGATMNPFGRHNGQRSFPSEERSRSSPEWNHYRIVATNGIVRLSVNGKEVAGGENCNYRKGYLALESEGAPVEFRNIRIQELPSDRPSSDLVAPEDQGWRALFSGLDLRGWKTNDTVNSAWRVDGERLRATPDATPATANVLWSERSFANAEFVIDVKQPKPANGQPIASPAVQIRDTTVPLPVSAPGGYQRFTVTVRGNTVTVQRGVEEVGRHRLPTGSPTRGPLGIRHPGGSAELMNLYARDL